MRAGGVEKGQETKNELYWQVKYSKKKGDVKEVERTVLAFEDLAVLLGDALVDRGKDVAALAGLVVGVGGGDLGDHLSFGFLVSLLLFFGVVTFVFWCR